MALRFDEELHASSLHRSRRIGDERREVESLDVEAFKMVENGGTNVTLSRSRFAENEESRSEDSQGLECCET